MPSACPTARPPCTPPRKKAPLSGVVSFGVGSTPVAVRSSGLAYSATTTSNTNHVVKQEMTEYSVTSVTGVPLDRFTSAILSGHDGPSTADLEGRVAAHLQDRFPRINRILEVYKLSLRRERGMSWVLSILIDEILSAFSSDFAFLPLGNTPLKGARTLRKPDGVFVPPHIVKSFRELRDKHYPDKAKEDADELGYWKSMVDCASEISPAMDPAVIAVDTDGLPGTTGDDGDEAATVEQEMLQAERQNVRKGRKPCGDATLISVLTDITKQCSAIPWSQVPVVFEMKRLGSVVHKVPDNVESDAYSQTTTGSKKRKIDTPGNVASNRKVHVTLNDVQLARYMTEMRSALGHRTHTFGCLLQGKKFIIKYADAYGLIESEEVEFTQSDGLRKMATIIVALAHAKREALGFDPRFKPPMGSGPHLNHDLPASLAGWRYRVDEDIIVTIKELIHVQWCQTGRGTSVYLVDHVGHTRVLKTSYPHSSRPREAVLLQTARQRLEAKTPGAGAGVTQVYSSAQGDLLSTGFRTRLSSKCVDEYDRRLEILLVEKLEPLHSVKTPEYIGPFVDILHTIVALSDVGICHRDISTGNLMLRRLPGPQDKIQGVLSDFDLAVDLHDPDMRGSSHLHRTGTLPFLSMSLLKQLEKPALRFPYILRFDLESCVYVFLWDAMLHPEGRNTLKSQVKQAHKLLDSWMTSDPEALYKDKHALADTFSDKYLPEDDEKVAESFPYLVKCQTPFDELLSAISEGYVAWRREVKRSKLGISSPKWLDLCGNFEPSFVLERFKAMQTILTEPVSV